MSDTRTELRKQIDASLRLIVHLYRAVVLRDAAALCRLYTDGEINVDPPDSPAGANAALEAAGNLPLEVLVRSAYQPINGPHDPTMKGSMRIVLVCGGPYVRADVSLDGGAAVVFGSWGQDSETRTFDQSVDLYRTALVWFAETLDTRG